MSNSFADEKEHFEEFKKACAILASIHPLVRIGLPLLCFLAFQTPTPSRFVMIMYAVVFSLLVGSFEYIQLNEARY